MCAEPATACAVTCQDDPLLTAKLRATEIRSPLTARQSLFDRLSDGSRGPVTVVSAPAGTGKTALVSSWVQAGLAPGRVAWLSLDVDDRRPEIFWTYVIEALARGGVALSAIRSPERPGPVDDSLLPQLCERLAEQAEPAVLVLDNVHLLGAGAVTDGIDFLITHAGPQFRLIAISRATPALPLHRYRLAGWLTEIGADELTFTTAETRALLAEHGIHLTENSVRLLVDRTEGWAAGLRLAAMSLRGKRTGDAEWTVRGFSGERADVAEYFVAEVLDGQPPGIREFLLATSVADVLTPELAAELSGRPDSAEVLRSLVGANAFVTTSDEYHYRCHPLFRDVLRTRLRQDAAGHIAYLHRRTAAWLADNGQPVTAAYHAGAAGDWAAAASLLVEHLAIGRLLIGIEAPRFRRVFERMPAETDGAAPAIVRAALATAANRPQVGTQHLAAAKAQNKNRSLPVRLAVAVLETLSAAARMDVDGTVAAATVVAGVSVELAAKARPVPADLFAIVLAGKGAALLWSGQLTQAEDSLTAALRAADAAGLELLKTRALGQIALLNAINGRLRQATRWGGRAAQLADRLDLAGDDRPAVIDVAFAWIHTERCEPEAARRHVKSVNSWDDPLAAAALTAVLGRQHDDSAGLVAPTPADVPEPPWLTRPLRTAEPGAAAADSGAATLTARVEAWLRTATEQLDMGRTEHATKALDRALRLAAPEGMRRPIVQASPRLRHLLQRDAELTGRHTWLRPDDADAPGADQAAPRLVERLTDRELEVLRNMAALLSTEEIARAMFVSVNTVKTHIRGVLRKLSVNKRNDAIRRARDLGLL